jgi:glycosyltransferase involved in cell wall biosynthesis
MSKKVLMIINEFPPTGESGVQRPVKFIKYLVQLGYEVFVVTPKNPTKNVLDYTLLNDIPDSVKIFKTSSFGIKGKAHQKIGELRKISNDKLTPKKLFWKFLKSINDIIMPIDKQIGWTPFAYAKAKQVIKKYSIKNIYITGFPFSAFIIGKKLKQTFGDKVNFIADYRDAWQFEPKIDKNVSKRRKNIMVKIEDSIVPFVDKFVFATEFIRQQYLKKFPNIENRSMTITNGYDEDDFISIKKPQKMPFFNFVYMGKFYDFKRSPIPLMKSLEKYKQSNEEFNFQFNHIGTLSEQLLNKLKSYPFYNYLGYKTHDEAINISVDADVLILIINNDPSSLGVYTGKFFEYLMLKKPILALVPKSGIVDDFFKKHDVGYSASPDNEEEIFTAVEKIINHKQRDTDMKIIEKFSRLELTKQLITNFK